MAKKKRLNKAERQKRENMKWSYMFVALVITLTVYFAAFVEADNCLLYTSDAADE